MTKILDCTLRDGGYYTNWDFKWELVENYLRSFDELPVDYLEIGYRNNPLEGYNGEYYYCPSSTLKKISALSKKPLAIILNEKSIIPNDIVNLLEPCLGMVKLVRMAVDPANFDRATETAKHVKKMGFELSFNVMYMSDWSKFPSMTEKLSEIEGLVDYFYMVDSFGGVYPDQVKKTIDMIRSKANLQLGFHGHNNLEMALANTLAAIDEGVDIVDGTITGMGRGAGNLKTELLLTALNGRGDLTINYNELTKVTEAFGNMQEEYGWGTSLPYMVSGANSLPQKNVMSWVSKRFYSYNSIIRTLKNRSTGRADNIQLKQYEADKPFENILIVGGGNSVYNHRNSIMNFINQKNNVLVIHSSSKNVPNFQELPIQQIHCLSGNEGYRLESVFTDLDEKNRKAVLPPYPRTMGTYIPKALKNVAFELPEISFTDKFEESITAVVLQLALMHNPDSIYTIGYDGYGSEVTKQEMELFQENEFLFNTFTSQTGIELTALLPTEYQELQHDTVYKYL